MLPPHIFYTQFSTELSFELYHRYLKLLSIKDQQINGKYRRWQDRHAHLYGKLLLASGLKELGFDISEIKNINYGKFGKPFLNLQLNFNLSHSGCYVLCVICKDIQVGIDIEEIKEIDIYQFENLFTKSEWQTITKDKNPLNKFFNFWTIKESVLKAEGWGLSEPLTNIKITGTDSVQSVNSIWYITNIAIAAGYHASLATEKPIDHFNLTYLDFSDPFKWLY